MDLVVLAAGMGSRFGGLKQIEPIDEYGNFIIDYSVYDALEAGFDRVIFIIKEENLEIFKSTIGKRIESKIETHYVFQSNENIPEGYSLPESRVKPLGTAHAILSAKDAVSDKFIIINADDFYGKDAFKVAYNYLKGVNEKGKYANVAYKVTNTLTENGSVKRGVMSFDDDRNLVKLTESSIELVDGKVMGTPLDTNKTDEISSDSLVSMNMFCFTREIMDYLDESFPRFFDENKNSMDKAEYLIPSVVSEMMNKGLATVKVIGTSATWYGITYREDEESVIESIKKLVSDGKYVKGLFQNK